MQEVEHKHSVGIEIKAPAEEEVKSVPIQKLDQSEKASAVQEQLDQRTKLQQTLKKLLIQMKRGCSKAVCFSKHCLKNAFCKFNQVLKPGRKGEAPEFRQRQGVAPERLRRAQLHQGARLAANHLL